MKFVLSRLVYHMHEFVKETRYVVCFSLKQTMTDWLVWHMAV